MMNPSMRSARFARRANGYIMKQEATEKVLVAVRRILGGDIYLSEKMANKLLHQYISGAPADLNSRLSALSDRELEVFRLIGEGRSTPTDRRVPAPQHQDGRNLSGPYQRQIVAAQRPRTCPARNPIENWREAILEASQ